MSNLEYINSLIKNCEKNIDSCNNILKWEKPHCIIKYLEELKIDLVNYQQIKEEIEVIKLIRLYVPQNTILDFIPSCDYEKVKKVLEVNDYE